MELKRILYVEDEPDIRAVTELALVSLGGFEVAVCESGEEALKRAVSFSPELILLDVMMPHLDGPETLQALRQLPGIAEVPVVFMTAKVQSSEVEAYKDLGAADVIAKPFDPMTLSDQVREIWNRSQI
ncbi:response regulator [Marinobacter mobilis]|uniref:Response regulator receiver domain-containing protein n=1 Tax=Marinobacter mobilis TaxID=488533 RepID=A0A1H2PYG1_9GAMM|nr:response regulator [Marinobacter mobilis]SDV99910.1 Response regulator receiver domain-containing protein [Marinobacter mobilis]